MEIEPSTEEWWSHTLEPAMGIIRVHAIPAPPDPAAFEYELGLEMVEPGSPEALVERVKDVGRRLGYGATASAEGGTEPIWIVTFRK